MTRDWLPDPGTPLPNEWQLRSRRRSLRQGDIGLAGDSLPIVFTGRPRNKLIVLAIDIVLMGIGIMMIFDQAGGLVRGAGPFRRGVLPSEVGWMVGGIGLVFTVLALLQLARACPRLELNDEGILYSRCLQGADSSYSGRAAARDNHSCRGECPVYAPGAPKRQRSKPKEQ
jgi:hypothetical protein